MSLLGRRLRVRLDIGLEITLRGTRRNNLRSSPPMRGPRLPYTLQHISFPIIFILLKLIKPGAKGIQIVLQQRLIVIPATNILDVRMRGRGFCCWLVLLVVQASVQLAV